MSVETRDWNVLSPWKSLEMNFKCVPDFCESRELSRGLCKTKTNYALSMVKQALNLEGILRMLPFPWRWAWSQRSDQASNHRCCGILVFQGLGKWTVHSCADSMLCFLVRVWLGSWFLVYMLKNTSGFLRKWVPLEPRDLNEQIKGHLSLLLQMTF